MVAATRTGIAADPRSALAFLAFAMGLQTATLTGVGPLTVHTTFVTGMLNKLAQLISHIVFRAYDLSRSKAGNSQARREQPEELQMALFLVWVWVFYVAGAALGTWSFAAWQLKTLFIAVVLLAVSIATDQFRPLSIKEEQEQSER
jgi:uncharacterized membrane protein YoaK (UPF0700 family)